MAMHCGLRRHATIDRNACRRRCMPVMMGAEPALFENAGLSPAKLLLVSARRAYSVTAVHKHTRLASPYTLSTPRGLPVFLSCGSTRQREQTLARPMALFHPSSADVVARCGAWRKRRALNFQRPDFDLGASRCDRDHGIARTSTSAWIPTRCRSRS